MSNTTPEERDCQVPEDKKELPLSNTSEKERIAAQAALIEKAQTGLTTSDLNAIVQEVGKKPLQTPLTKVIEACNQSSESLAKKKAIEESRKLIDTFSKNLATYPKPLTYEGSVVFCVAISVNEGTSINLNGLPQTDKELVLSQLPPDATTRLSSGEASVNVEFDEMRDFVLIYHTSTDQPVKLKYFNTVIHPQKLPDTNVPVEKADGKVTVGTHLVLDQRRIAKLVGIAPHEKHKDKDENEDSPQRRQPVAGRNAYEIRADVLQMAIDWLHERDDYKDENDVINLAKKFYSFVEDRRR